MNFESFERCPRRKARPLPSQCLSVTSASSFLSPASATGPAINLLRPLRGPLPALRTAAAAALNDHLEHLGRRHALESDLVHSHDERKIRLLIVFRQHRDDLLARQRTLQLLPWRFLKKFRGVVRGAWGSVGTKFRATPFTGDPRIAADNSSMGTRRADASGQLLPAQYGDGRRPGPS